MGKKGAATNSPQRSQLERAQSWAAIVGTVTAICSLVALAYNIHRATTSEQDQRRAWLVTEGMAANISLEPGRPPEVALMVKNVGQSPAIDVRITIYISAVPANDTSKIVLAQCTAQF